MEVLLVPGLICFFGLVIYALAIVGYSRTGTPSPARFGAYFLMLVAAFFGWRLLSPLLDSQVGVFARAEIIGKKALYSHYLAFLLPLFLLAACVAYDFWSRRTGRVKDIY